MADTSIEWTDKVWNPTTGCDRVSPGCDHCYALTMAARLKGMGSAKYQNDGNPRTSGPGFGITEHPDALAVPLSWRKPQRVFVNSMSDVFHDGVSDRFIAKVFAVMAATPQHIYQLLTKRHGRMRSLLSRTTAFGDTVLDYLSDLPGGERLIDEQRVPWPLPNVWLGVSVETQREADFRIPALLDTPAAVRWLSCEPLLGPVDLTRVRGGIDALWPDWAGSATAGTGTPHPLINWVVVGGESGPGARPMDPAWARSIRHQCQASEVPFLFKQWGEHVPRCKLALCGHPCSCNGSNPSHPFEMRRVGKGKAGRVLDGRTWDEYPDVSAGARAGEGRARSSGPSEARVFRSREADTAAGAPNQGGAS